MLSFKNYFQLNERHNNVANEINSNTKMIIKLVIDSLKEGLDDAIRTEFTDIKTDYEYLYAELYIISDYLQRNNQNSITFFNKLVDIKFRNKTVKLPVRIIMSLDSPSGANGAFSIDDNEQNPEIDVYIDPLEFTDNINDKVSIVRNFIDTLSHELNHCYQWLSRKNYNKGKLESLADNIPGFSSLAYYITKSEIESFSASAYSDYKAIGKKYPYFNVLLRRIDHAISSEYNEEGMGDSSFDYKLSISFLIKKYKRLRDYKDIFILEYWLTCTLPETRYYKLVANDPQYKAFKKSVNRKEVSQIADIIQEIYNTLDEKFLDENYNAEAAYKFMRSKRTIKKLISSVSNAKAILDKVKNNDFASNNTAMDEEEDEPIKGRPDLTL